MLSFPDMCAGPVAICSSPGLCPHTPCSASFQHLQETGGAPILPTAPSATPTLSPQPGPLGYSVIELLAFS